MELLYGELSGNMSVQQQQPIRVPPAPLATFGRFSYNRLGVGIDSVFVRHQVKFLQPGPLLSPPHPPQEAVACESSPAKKKKADNKTRKAHTLPSELKLFHYKSSNNERVVIVEEDDPK